MRRWLLPEHIEDILPAEARTVERLRRAILDLFAAHGYELVQTIKSSSHDELEFGEGCIYPILHRLQAQGMLVSAQERKSGRLRVVYRVTPRGRSQLAQSLGTWRDVVSAVNQVLQGGECGHAAVA